MRKFLDPMRDNPLMALSVESPPLLDWIGFEPVDKIDDTFSRFVKYENFLFDCKESKCAYFYLDGSPVRGKAQMDVHEISQSLIHSISQSVILGSESFAGLDQVAFNMDEFDVNESPKDFIDNRGLGDAKDLVIIGDPFLLRFPDWAIKHDKIQLVPHSQVQWIGEYRYSAYVMLKSSIKGFYLDSSLAPVGENSQCFTSDGGLVLWKTHRDQADNKLSGTICLSLRIDGPIYKFCEYVPPCDEK